MRTVVRLTLADITLIVPSQFGLQYPLSYDIAGCPSSCNPFHNGIAAPVTVNEAHVVTRIMCLPTVQAFGRLNT